ncbi:hypothetical protein ABZZ04_30705 [Streptomyces sp. NPDC006435]|uniref:hypothetical protein n=1 Tax=Streptomyces sp. NPDC006435 TaxID=3154300 RepID=UPI0033BA433D
MKFNRSRIGKIATGVIGTAMIAGSAALAAPATAAPADGSAATKYCAKVVGQKDASGKLETLRESCSSNSPEEARRGLRAAASTKLMTWYSDGGYKGKMVSDIYGDYGTCDGAGYGFEPSDDWKDSLSSIRGYGQCNKLKLTNIAKTHSKSFTLPESFGDEIYNNNVGYVKIWHA